MRILCLCLLCSVTVRADLIIQNETTRPLTLFVAYQTLTDRDTGRSAVLFVPPYGTTVLKIAGFWYPPSVQGAYSPVDGVYGGTASGMTWDGSSFPGSGAITDDVYWRVRCDGFLAGNNLVGTGPGLMPSSITVPVIGEVALPAWALSTPEAAVFFIGFALACGVRLVRAGNRWFKRVGEDTNQ